MFKTLVIAWACVCYVSAAWGTGRRPSCFISKPRGSPVILPRLGKPIYYSMNPDAEMQKPSLGFDYLQRFSGESGDWATFALQGRLALTVNGEDGANEIKLEPQIYNAYFKVKTPGPYVWVGHNRPAFGLSLLFRQPWSDLEDLGHPGFRL